MIWSCDIKQAWHWSQSGNALLIDVRTIEAQMASGTPVEAKLMHWSALESRLSELLIKNNKLLLLCDVGQESLDFCQSLESKFQGFVYSIQGGFDAWFLADLPTVSFHASDDAVRYDRQVRLSGVGQQGQNKLKQSHVLIVGAGGLGVPALQYLVAAGVGRISLVDDDVVGLSNLHRQVIYQTAQVGELKAQVAAQWAAKLNPNVQVMPITQRFSDLNAADLLSGVDVVLDCSDNFVTRKSINLNCLRFNTPWVFAGVTDFEIQLSFFDSSDKQAPCFLCLFPGLIQPKSNACDTQGVLGTTPGIAGTMQANEVMKYLLELPGVLKGCLRVDNLLTHQSKVIKYRANNTCSHHTIGS